MSATKAALIIDRLGERGEGIARTPEGLVFIPYALPGEAILAEIDGSRGKLAAIIAASPDRIAARCPYFGGCGGCAVQTLAAPAYAQWKRDLVASALCHAGLSAEIMALADAHGEGRRRAAFHVRYPGGHPSTGFMEARAHTIVEIDACPLLAPSLEKALPVARAIATALAPSQKPLDILMTGTQSGLDADIRGHGPFNQKQAQELVRIAFEFGLARLSNHGEVLIAQRAPLLAIGKATVILPPRAFLQATKAGEEALAARVCAALAGAKHIADLFSGIGTFALRLAEFAAVDAFDLDETALAALAKGAHAAHLRPAAVRRRDLFRQPLSPKELEIFDAAVFDPPRAGAENQARALAASPVPLIAAVSCNPKTFARDAAILCAAGYELARVEPIDQFRHSRHVEVFACFRRPVPCRRKRRPLLG
ncbi:MAG: class I SAM-dependent RNA methyltransferase [Methylocapsa sp.]|nr:class I SAM-dependent RNA methyltransferase [Methylocapsa sp.]